MKTCKTCHKSVSKRSTGYCNKCRPRYGINNPFYGKRHTDLTLQTIKEKTSKITKDLWTNPEYRQKVIENTTGKKRSNEFKLKQKNNAFKQFENQSQRDMRSKKLKETWELGKILYHDHPSTNHSKIENEFYEAIVQRCFNVQRKTIHLAGKWIIPDVVINNRHIYEFFGDYWHGNPKKYKARDIVHHNLTAQEIWDKDKKRIDMLWQLGYSVTIIWESDYKANKETILDEISSAMNWDDV
jgi:G:T-mismatch repair DNA endonuclease (very short patch repair protein)